jgi:pyruvate kinase
MIDAGVNVFRVNFSHADYADVKEKIKIIRDLMMNTDIPQQYLAIYKDQSSAGVMGEVVVNDGDLITFNCRGHSWNCPKVFMKYKISLTMLILEKEFYWMTES